MYKLTIFLLLSIFFLGCSEEEPAPEAPISAEEAMQARPSVTRVRLLLNWFPEAEHGGYYTASINGYYREAGLDVEIIPGGVDVMTVPQVANGQVEFGLANADQILFGRAAQANVVALFAPLQVSPRCIMVHEESGIDGFEDLNDMTLAMNMSDSFAAFLMKKYPIDNVQIVRYPGNIATFLNDKNFGQQAYNISEPFVAMEEGANPKVLMLSDAGYNPYTSILMAKEEYIAENREIVEEMVRASARGWRQYLAAPRKTNTYINSLNEEMGLEILQFGAEKLQDMVITEETEKNGLGSMTAERWQTLHDTLVELEQIDEGDVDLEAVYTNEFLEPVKTQ